MFIKRNFSSINSIARLTNGNNDYGFVTGVIGLNAVEVEIYLCNKLKSLKKIENNTQLRTYISLSLDFKKQEFSDDSYSFASQVEKYISCLNVICLYDLQLCAALLGADSLQLKDGSYFQISRMIL